MLTQKPISLRIDTELLRKLDEFCAARGQRRNQVINRAIAYYLGFPYN